jgi:membrane protease YdiL (CAAX protease family)
MALKRFHREEHLAEDRRPPGRQWDGHDPVGNVKENKEQRTVETTSTFSSRPAILNKWVLFFGLTFLVSWLIWIPLALSHLELIPMHIPDGISNIVRLLGVLGPSIVAIGLATTGGRKTVGELLGRFAIWRVGFGWWLVAVAVQPVFLLLVALLYNLAGGQPPLALVSQTSAAAFVINVIFLALATLGEEIGWRGVALPGLLQNYNGLSASLILGAVWTAWHLPFWLLMDSYDAFGAGYFLLNLLSIVPMTIYITWFFRHTRGSLLLPAACHLSYNIINVAVVQVTSALVPYAILIGLQWCLVLVIIFRDRLVLRK